MASIKFNFTKMRFFCLIAGLAAFMLLSSSQLMGQVCVTTSSASPTANVCSGTGTTTLTNSRVSVFADYQWQVSINGGAYANIANATTNPYTTAAGLMTSGNNYTFKCLVEVAFSCSEGLSGATATITPVAGPSAAAAGADQTGKCATSTFVGNAPAVGETGAWTLVSGAGTITTPSSFASAVTGLGSGNNEFKWTITKTSNGCATTDNVIINSQDGTGVTAYASTNCPVSTTAATLSLLPSSFTFTSIQWQQSTNGGAYGNISGATTGTYNATGLSSGNTYLFKANITTPCGTYSPISTAATSPYGFFDYAGGNNSYATANTATDCFNNLVANQRYCFAFVYSHDIEMDWQPNGCAGCSSIYVNITGSSSTQAIISGTGCSGANSNSGSCYTTTTSCSACVPTMYNSSCGVVEADGIQLGSGCASPAMTEGNVYYVCFTVPATCGGMSMCPQIHCTAGNCAASPLPIELLYFNAVAVNDQVQLKWVTATETNNDYFTVEKSSNGKSFEEVVKVNGAGNSSSILNYNTIDESPLKGISYYRLKQTDYDGKYAYSKIVPVEMGSSSVLKLMYISPDHATNRLQYQFSYTQNKPLMVEVLDIVGQTVYSQKVSSDDNGRVLNVDAASLGKGVYLLKISDGIYSEVKKFIY